MFVYPWLLLGAQALGSPVTVRYCQNVDVDFLDASAGTYWEDNAVHRAARGFRTRVINRLTGVYVWEGWLYTSGSYVGCTPQLSLDTTTPYRIEFDSVAEVQGNIIGALDDDVNLQFATAAIGHSPTQSGTVVLTPLPGTTEPRWRQLAVVAFAIQRYNVQIVNEWLYLYSEMTCLGGSACGGETDPGGVGYLKLGQANTKTVIAHELGHTLQARRDAGGYNFNASDTAPIDYCDGTLTFTNTGHRYVTKEYQSKAAGEGLANFYSYLTWNDPVHNGACEYSRATPLDFNLDNTKEKPAWEPLACFGDPVSGSGSGGVDADEFDWLEDMVLGSDVVGCSGTLENRSTEFDWGRYLWALVTVEDVPVSTIWEVLDDADPHDWCSAEEVGGCELATTRWLWAMTNNGLFGEHVVQMIHGLDH